jgi:hypothetical protein
VKVRRDDLEGKFASLLDGLRLQENVQDLFFETVRQVWQRKNRQQQELLTDTRKRTVELDVRRQRSIDAVLEGKIQLDLVEIESLL